MRLIKVKEVNNPDNIDLVGQIFEVVADDLDGAGNSCYVVKTTKGETIYFYKEHCWLLTVDEKKRFKYVDTVQQL